MLKNLIKKIHEEAVKKGFWVKKRSFAEQIALMHSELSEALEDDRAGKPPIYYEGKKPCGVVSELADCAIRIFDTCGYYGYDLEAMIKEKMEYNKSRPYKHGKKY